MEPYRLAKLYARLRKAADSGDQQAAITILSEALGCELPAQIAPVSPLNADQCVTRLSYRGFKPAELAMLAADLKPVIKFEDLPLKDAERFTRHYEQHYRLQRGTPYYKDYLLLRSRRGGLPGETPMTFLYASRTSAGQQLRHLERTQPDAIEAAGEMLGFPACCSATFAATFAASRKDQDALNDDAVYALLSATMHSPGLARLDPLTDYDLLAFYPCGPNCEHAAAFADRTFEALERSAPAAAARATAELGRPVLYWRMPFFFVFDGAAISGDCPGIQYSRARIHIFPDPAVARIQRLFGSLILPLLDRGDHVSIDNGDVVIRANGTEVARVRQRADRPPVLGIWA